MSSRVSINMSCTLWESQSYRAVEDSLATTAILEDVGSTDVRASNLLTPGLSRARDGAATSLTITVAILMKAATGTRSTAHCREGTGLLL